MSDRKMLVACKVGHKTIKFGWMYGYRCKPGVKFYLETPEHFSGEWMDIFDATEDQLKRVPEKYRAKALAWLKGGSVAEEKPVLIGAPVGNADAKTSPMEPGTLVKRGPGRPRKTAEPK